MVKEWYKLSNEKLHFLFRYYIILFFVGIATTIIALLHESIGLSFSVTVISLIGGIGCSLIGSTVFYLRKLYKSCINLEFIKPTVEDDFKREIGVYYYYFLRPIFSIGQRLFAIHPMLY